MHPPTTFRALVRFAVLVVTGCVAAGCARMTPPLKDLGFVNHEFSPVSRTKSCRAVFTRGDTLITANRSKTVIYDVRSRAFVFARYNLHPDYEVQNPRYMESIATCAWKEIEGGSRSERSGGASREQAAMYVLRDQAVVSEIKELVSELQAGSGSAEVYTPKWFEQQTRDKTEDGLPRAVRTSQWVDVSTVEGAIQSMDALDVVSAERHAVSVGLANIRSRDERMRRDRIAQERRTAEQKRQSELARAARERNWQAAVSAPIKKGEKVCTRGNNLFGFVEAVVDSRVKVYVVGSVDNKPPGFFFRASTGSVRFTSKTIEANRWFDRDEVGVCGFQTDLR